MEIHKCLNKDMLTEKSTYQGAIAGVVGLFGMALIWFGKVPGDPMISLGVLATTVLGILGILKKE